MTKALLGVLAGCAVLTVCIAFAADRGEAKSRLRIHADERTVIQLSAPERAHFRKGMRVYLESIEGIIDGMAKHKMALVAKAAKKSGASMVEDVPLDTALSVPPEFGLMSMDTHEKFDDLAKEVREGANKLEVMNKLGTIMAACTSCHAAFKLAPQ